MGEMNLVDNDNSDEDYEPPKKRRMSTKKNIFVNEAICSALDRYKISSRAAVHVLIPVIEALGFNADDFIINRVSLQNQRSKNRARCAKEIKDNFTVKRHIFILFRLYLCLKLTFKRCLNQIPCYILTGK